MKMPFVVGIEISKVQRRRHCQFVGGEEKGVSKDAGGTRRKRLRPQQHLKMPLTTERKFIAEIVGLGFFFQGGRQVCRCCGRGVSTDRTVYAKYFHAV